MEKGLQTQTAVKHLDFLFDIAIYVLVLICFSGAALLIAKTAITPTNNIMEGAAMAGIGIVVSLFFVWVKSKNQSNQ